MYSKNYITVFAAGIRCKTCLLLFIFIKSKLSDNLQGLITTSLFSKVFEICNSFFFIKMCEHKGYDLVCISCTDYHHCLLKYLV